MEAVWVVLAVLGLWLLVAVLLALVIGRAARIGELKHRDEVFHRDLARESARLAEELDRGLLQELSYIRSRSTELARDSPEAAGIAIAAERALVSASAAVELLARLR